MINQLSNPINRNRSAAKISKVMSSTRQPHRQLQAQWPEEQLRLEQVRVGSKGVEKGPQDHLVADPQVVLELPQLRHLQALPDGEASPDAAP